MRLLIVDDESDLRLALSMALAEAGVSFDTAVDGQEGLYKALKWDYDAIVLDIMMPKMDGWEMLDRFRRKKQTPVLMLTARGELDDRLKTLDQDSDDFLPKPFEMDELMARLRAIIRRSADKSTTVLYHRNLELDTTKKTLCAEGSPVALTSMEYALLEYLMMHCDQVVSRSNLFEHLFDGYDDSLSDIVDSHVCTLRRKLGIDCVKTRRGLGYILER